MTQLEVTPQAEQDLEDIGDYIALDSPERALSFIRKIRERCQSIVLAPEGYPLCPHYGEGVRKMAYQNYLLFYLYDSDEKK
jgi:toxin ParE1/3/4